MFNNRVLAIIKRELREKLFSKSFIIMTLLIPVFMFIIIGIQALIFTMGSDESAKIHIVSSSDEILSSIQKEMNEKEFIKSGSYSIKYEIIRQDNLNEYLKENKYLLLDDILTGIIFVPSTVLKNKELEYYSKNPNNNLLFMKLKDPINKALIGIYFKDKTISDEEIYFASDDVDFNGFRVSKDEAIEEEGWGNIIAAFIFTFLLYFSLIFIGTMMMRSVVQEKTNRIVELLLSSVNANELMTGKILGTSIMGVAQMIIWLSPIILLVTTSWFMLPADLILKMNIYHIFYFIVNYFIGMITYLGLFASVGAIFDNDQDAQQGLWPIMMLIMIPFFIAISMQNNPDSALIRISSLIPFASILVMPARITVIEVPALEFIFSFIVNLATMFFIFILSGKIYRVGILMTGKKPKWSEVMRWVKYKY